MSHSALLCVCLAHVEPCVICPDSVDEAVTRVCLQPVAVSSGFSVQTEAHQRKQVSAI